MALRFSWITNLFASKTSLREQIEAYGLSQYVANLPVKWYKAQMAEIERLREAGSATKALPVGEVAPRFALVNQNNETKTLTQLLQQGPVVITFYRGSWCPTCNLQLRAMQQQLAEFEQFPASLVAVTAQTAEENNRWRTEANLGYDVLTDEGYGVARQFGTAYRVSQQFKDSFAELGISLEQLNGPTGADQLVNPSTFVIDQRGTIVWRYIDVLERPEPADILNAVRESYERQPERG